MDKLWQLFGKEKPLAHLSEPLITMKALEDSEPVPVYVRDVLLHGPYYPMNFPNHSIVRCNVLSKGYHNCCGCAILCDGTVGVSHYSTSKVWAADPRKYIVDILEGISQPGHQVSAAVIGGDAVHFSAIMSILVNRKIPVLSGYYDGWSDESNRDEMVYDVFSKDLLVLPSRKEAYLLLQDRITFSETYDGCIRFGLA